MKAFTIVLKILWVLLLVSPILGALGIFPAPTADLYNTPQAFSFIEALTATGYLNGLIAVVFALAIAFVVTGRTAAAALLVLPVTVNIICFHAFLDGGLLTAGAMMADLLLFINAFFLWKNREAYRRLWNTAS